MIARDGSPILGAIRASRLLHVLACAPVAAIIAAALGLPTHARAAAPPVAAPKPYLVALDAGHGGSPDPNNPSKPYDSGAVGTNGLLEKDLALDEVLRIQRLLVAQGVDVLLTRDSDVLIDITPRMQKAIDAGADLFVSVHFNGWTDPGAAGSLVLYPKDFCQPFATRLASSLARALGPFGVLPDGLQYRPEMFQHATMPTATIEPVFLTNAHEAALMTNDAVRDSIARSVVDAVDEEAGPAIAERRAVANGWDAIAPAFGRGATADVAPPPLATQTADSTGVDPGSIVPLPSTAAGAPTPIPVFGGGHADQSPRARPSATAAPTATATATATSTSGGGALSVSSTPDPSPPWFPIALGICVLALVAVLRRPVLHGLAIASAAILRGIARLDGREVPLVLRLESRATRRSVRRRALVDRRRSRARPTGAAMYDAYYFRAAPLNRARRR